MSNRKLTEFGLPLFLAYIILFIGFFGLSVYLFSNTDFAEYFYILLGLGLLIKLTDRKRNEFLKLCFSENNYLKLRFLENLVAIMPFVLFLVYQKSYPAIPVLVVFAAILTFIDFNTSLNFNIPTPFYKRPFELTVGVRYTLFIFPIAYFLTYISVSVGNFNIGVFSMLLVFMITLSYYSKLENEYYVWSFSLTPKEFLAEKIKTGLPYSTLAIIPIVIPLGIYFYPQLETLVTFVILGYSYIITLILAKYSVYPNEMNIPQGILIAISFIFPPILVGIIPYFYHQSSKRLNGILE